MLYRTVNHVDTNRHTIEVRQNGFVERIFEHVWSRRMIIRLNKGVFFYTTYPIPNDLKYGSTEGYFIYFGDIANGCYYIA